MARLSTILIDLRLAIALCLLIAWVGRPSAADSFQGEFELVVRSHMAEAESDNEQEYVVSPLGLVSMRLVDGYQVLISSHDKGSCNFVPSCSRFTKEAIRRGGVVRGILMGADRLLRCHPYGLYHYRLSGVGGKAYDPVDDYMLRQGDLTGEGRIADSDHVRLADSAEAAAAKTVNTATEVDALTAFGDYLFEQGDFVRAGMEYERSYFISDRGPMADSIYLRAGDAYLRGSDFDQARRVFNTLVYRRPQGAWLMLSRQRLAHVLYLQHDYRSVIELLEGSKLGSDAISDSVHLSGLSTSLVSLSHARLSEWPVAEAYACEQLRIAPKGNMIDICSLITTGRHLPRRSKLKACLMSAVMPGSGKLATGRVYDAVFAFVTVVSTGWMSYRGFDEDGVESIRGWVLGTLAGGLYLGDIYGTAVSVDLFNKRLERQYFHAAEVSLGIRF